MRLATFLLLFLATRLDGQVLGAVHRFHTVGEGVYVAEPRYTGGNSTIIVADDHVVVVDAQGSEAAARALIGEIGRLTNLPVRYVVTTHWHGDHHGGTAAFREAYPGVVVIAHPETVSGIGTEANREIHGVAGFLRGMLGPAEEDLASGTQDGVALSREQRAQLRAYVDEEAGFFDAVPPDFRYDLPDRTVEDELVLEDGGRRIEVRHPGPAHTAGDLLVYLPDEEILLAGDLVTVPYVVPRSGFPGSYASVLAELEVLGPRVIVPGHGRPGRHLELVQLMRAFMRHVYDVTEELTLEGADLESVYETLSDDPQMSFIRDQIDWEAEGGLRFLDFETLLRMTVERAYEEAGGRNGQEGDSPQPARPPNSRGARHPPSGHGRLSLR